MTSTTNPGSASVGSPRPPSAVNSSEAGVLAGVCDLVARLGLFALLPHEVGVAELHHARLVGAGVAPVVAEVLGESPDDVLPRRGVDGQVELALDAVGREFQWTLVVAVGVHEQEPPPTVRGHRLGDRHDDVRERRRRQRDRPGEAVVVLGVAGRHRRPTRAWRAHIPGRGPRTRVHGRRPRTRRCPAGGATSALPCSRSGGRRSRPRGSSSRPPPWSAPRSPSPDRDPWAVTRRAAQYPWGPI
jgi:hypothetical protein